MSNLPSRRLALASFALAVLTACASLPTSEGRRMSQIITTYTEGAKRLDAFQAPYYGVEEDLASFGDYLSPEYFARAKALYQDALAALQPIDVRRLKPGEQIEYRLFHEDMTTQLASLQFPLELLDFNQMSNRLTDFIDESSPALSYFPFDSVQHYRAYLKRAEGFPAYIDRQIETLQRGVRTGMVLSCTIARDTLSTYAAALEPDVEKSPFYRPLSVMPASIRGAQREALAAAFRAMIATRIVPAVTKFDAYFRNEYLPHCRQSYGLAGLKDGAAIYAERIHAHTNLDWSPEKIHATGLAEVSRITTEMTAAKDALGFQGTLVEFRRTLLADERYFFHSSAELFAAFKKYQAIVEAAMPKLFSVRPKTPFSIEEAENPEAGAAQYYPPTDLKPLGRFVINTINLRVTPVHEVDTLFLHEAIPGHHYQLSIQFEQRKTLSEYRRLVFSSNAFAEGWALYAERLGREQGLVGDPLQLMGSLNDEMLRAVRLVVDTGIHHYGWSREHAIQYMTDNLTSDPKDIEAEADRYSVLPGQALGYKLGQLAILEQRDKAREALGGDFDLREFHDMVIGRGMVSLGVLDAMVDAWIVERQRSRHGGPEFEHP